MGYVDQSELSSNLRRLGLHVPAAVVRQLLEKHGDGKVRRRHRLANTSHTR